MLYTSEGFYQISKTARFTVTSVFNVIIKIAHDQQHPRGGIEYDVMYNSTKSNVLVFRSKLLKNVHVPEFEINNTANDRVSMYKYIGHCINDELSDDDDMTRTA